MAKKQIGDVLIQIIRLLNESTRIQMCLKLAVLHFSSIPNMRHCYIMAGYMDGWIDG